MLEALDPEKVDEIYQKWLEQVYENEDLPSELQFIQNTYGIQEEEIRLMMKNAVDTAFATDEVKARLYSELGIKG